MKKFLIILLALCIFSVPAVYADDDIVEEEEYIEEEYIEDSEEGVINDDSEGTQGSVWHEFENDDTDLSNIPQMSVPDGITVILDGNIIVFDAAQPALVNNRTMVPMRKIFEALGAEVTWDDSTKTAKATKNSMTVEITIGSNIMYSNGHPVEIDSPALLMRNKTYVPVRFISNALGADVKWDGENKIVYLTTK